MSEEADTISDWFDSGVNDHEDGEFVYLIPQSPFSHINARGEMPEHRTARVGKNNQPRSKLKKKSIRQKMRKIIVNLNSWKTMKETI
jgi:hypothetical protein